MKSELATVNFGSLVPGEVFGQDPRDNISRWMKLREVRVAGRVWNAISKPDGYFVFFGDDEQVFTT